MFFKDYSGFFGVSFFECYIGDIKFIFYFLRELFKFLYVTVFVQFFWIHFHQFKDIFTIIPDPFNINYNAG